MPTRFSAPDVLDREFLEIRANLLRLAAALDRIDRADGSAENDPRLKQIAQALEALAGEANDRAEQIQRTFSLPYDANWRDRLGLPQPP